MTHQYILQSIINYILEFGMSFLNYFVDQELMTFLFFFCILKKKCIKANYKGEDFLRYFLTTSLFASQLENHLCENLEDMER